MTFNNILKYTILLVSVVLCGACDRFDGDVTVPAYLKIDAMTVVDDPSDSWSQESGFFTNLIDAVSITIFQDGDTAEMDLGTFQLPCKVPVLRKGKLSRLRITPVVKQDGIAGKRIYYPYYEKVRLTDVPVAADSVTDLGILQTKYIPRGRMIVKWQEFFEPGPGDVSLDTVVTRCFATDTVLSGYGCGVIRIGEDQTSLSFWKDSTINLTDPQYYVYIEMDYWSDHDFSIGLYNPSTSGGQNYLKSHMTIYGKPEKGWQKIYINIGALWAKEYFYYPDIRPYFTILNSGGTKGNLYLDNIKLVVM